MKINEMPEDGEKKERVVKRMIKSLSNVQPLLQEFHHTLQEH